MSIIKGLAHLINTETFSWSYFIIIKFNIRSLRMLAYSDCLKKKVSTEKKIPDLLGRRHSLKPGLKSQRR